MPSAAVNPAVNDVQLPHTGALEVADGVVGRRRLGQPGKHGCLGNRDGFEGLAKIDLRSSGKSIGPITEKDLIHVNLKNLILGQKMLQLEG